MTKPTGRSETMLSAFLRDRAESTSGSLNSYAERVGVNHSTLWRWVNGEIVPTRGVQLDRLAAETDKPTEDLKQLAGITVEKACELILRGDSVEQDVNARFAEVVRERGEAIPLVAFMVFNTLESLDSKAKLVGLLEENGGEIPEDFTVETLQFALEIPDSGLVPEKG